MGVITSNLCWMAVAVLLVGLSFLLDPVANLKLYGVPCWEPSGLVLLLYKVFIMWLDSVIYLHHYSHEEKLPWYCGKEWTYLRGGLTTIDRDYGLINNIHHALEHTSYTISSRKSHITI